MTTKEIAFKESKRLIDDYYDSGKDILLEKVSNSMEIALKQGYYSKGEYDDTFGYYLFDFNQEHLKRNDPGSIEYRGRVILSLIESILKDSFDLANKNLEKITEPKWPEGK